MFSISSVLGLYLEVWWGFFDQKSVVGTCSCFYQLARAKTGVSTCQFPSADGRSAD